MISDKEIQGMVESALDSFADSGHGYELEFTDVDRIGAGVTRFGMTDGSQFEMVIKRIKSA